MCIILALFNPLGHIHVAGIILALFKPQRHIHVAGMKVQLVPVHIDHLILMGMALKVNLRPVENLLIRYS